MKDAHVSYWHWTLAFRHHTSLCILLQTIPTLPFTFRSDLLGLCRAQTPILRGSQVERSLKHPHDIIQHPLTISNSPESVHWTTTTYKVFLIEYSDTYLNLIPASIIALAVRIAPGITEEEFNQVVRSSLHKEVTASLSRFIGATLDFRCIHSSDISFRSIPFSSRLSPDEEVASDTYQLFANSRKLLNDMTIFPSQGTKTVGSIVTQNFWTSYYLCGSTFKHQADGTHFDSPDVTPLDCMRLYEETGGCVEGPVELRVAWTYSAFNPRVYFARGGDVVPISQYLQPIINRIIDLFPEVHRMNRFSPPKEPLTGSDVEIIYDYSSFTSSIDQVIEFVDSLSQFYRGVHITIIDVVKGPISIDLGELFYQYNMQCNHYQSFDTSKVFGRYSDDDLIFQHTCGMLGVEGNIFLATLLHGIHIRFVVGLNRSKCVGDDARAHYNTGDGNLRKDDSELLNYRIGGLGGIHVDKVAIFEADADPDTQAYRYVKRPFKRDQDLMVEGLLLTLPSLIPLLPLHDQLHTLHPSSTHPCRATFKSIIRLLKVLYTNSISLDEYGPVEMSMLVKHVRFLVRRIREVDPKGEHAPILRQDHSSRYFLPDVNLWGKIDYTAWVLEDLGYDEELKFFSRGVEDKELCDGRIGSTMVKETTKCRGFLVKLGYLKVEDLFDVVSLRSVGIDEMRIYISGDYISVKRFCVIREVPVWYTTLPGAM